MKLLVTGCKGMLGQDLVPRLKEAGFELQCVDIEEMDITNRKVVLEQVDAVKPRLVINCAAYTAVDKAEVEQELALAVNREGPAHLAEACSNLGIPLVHISTDYVFDGQKRKPYREDDPANPIGAYGQSKWKGEEEVRRILDKHIIVRTSWLFGFHGKNFVKTILRLSREKEVLQVVEDQEGCPTWTGDLSDVLVTIAERIRFDHKTVPWGIYHYCGKEATNWYNFALQIVEEGQIRGWLRVHRVLPIKTSEYQTAATRPLYSVLDCSKIQRHFGTPLRSWKVGLRIVVQAFFIS